MKCFFLYIYCFLYRSLHVFQSTFLLLSFTIVINLSLKDSGHNQFIWITCLLDQFTSKSLQYIVFQQFKVFQQFYQENCTQPKNSFALTCTFSFIIMDLIIFSDAFTYYKTYCKQCHNPQKFNQARLCTKKIK